MADVAEARKHVNKAVAFLVSRFGFEADVFKHLTAALENLKDEPEPVIHSTHVQILEDAPEPVNEEPESEPESAVEPEPEAAAAASQEPSEEAAPKPKRRRARRKSR